MRFVAGRGAVAERLVRGTGVAESPVRGTAVAERHREDVACCGTADAEPSGRLAGASLRSKDAAVAERLVRGTAMAELLLAREPPAQRTAGRGADEAAARQGRWHRARAGAGRQILSDSPSDLAITSAAQVLPYVFTAVRGISQSC